MKILNSSKVWFISDTHFGHENVIKFSKRPFRDREEMDRDMITLWQQTVKPDDDVFHLGDVSFWPRQQTENILLQLPGRIHLVCGNHDQKLLSEPLRKIFRTIADIKEIRVADPTLHSGWQHIVLCHYAMRVWNKSHYGAWNLHGHSHGSLEEQPGLLQMDVGVDATKHYKPVSYDFVKAHIATKMCKSLDGQKNGNLFFKSIAESFAFQLKNMSMSHPMFYHELKNALFFYPDHPSLRALEKEYEQLIKKEVEQLRVREKFNSET